MRPLDDGRARRTHRESTKESIVAGYTGRSLAMAGGIIGIAAVAAYFGMNTPARVKELEVANVSNSPTLGLGKEG